MPTQTVNLDKVEKQLAELLAIVEHNGEIVITQNGKPLARL
ncbi:MAG TPA: type II toxin-antitoxin system prevent-host-death family antitoxin [Pyrinomonadaceae bacterium]|nr:type II toxin-antitoxin system prevent-host-death family antitoxin [Pyrinomonadaceae bacterium]